MEFYDGFESTPKRKYIRREKIVKDSPKYKLIKEYPGSEPLGTIFVHHEGHLCYGMEYTPGLYQYNTMWEPEYFANWVGEYYKIIK